MTRKNGRSKTMVQLYYYVLVYPEPDYIIIYFVNIDTSIITHLKLYFIKILVNKFIGNIITNLSSASIY